MDYKCKVTNYGLGSGRGKNRFPTRIGDLFIGHGETVEIDDPTVIDDLEQWRLKARLGFEVVVDAENGQQTTPTKLIDVYASYSINELRRIAAGRKIKGVFRMKKPDIILKLEEDQNATRPPTVS